MLQLIFLFYYDLSDTTINRGFKGAKSKWITLSNYRFFSAPAKVEVVQSKSHGEHDERGKLEVTDNLVCQLFTHGAESVD